LGLSLAGHKAMVEMQFADFVSCGFNQIVNNLAKNHYRWGHAADVVVRMPTGGGIGAGAFPLPEQRKLVYPCPWSQGRLSRDPYDAKGLLASAWPIPTRCSF
jgi:2-oxoisovalerate dehydrogenase E1 component